MVTASEFEFCFLYGSDSQTPVEPIQAQHLTINALN